MGEGRSVGRSVGAVIAGIVIGIVLSLVTDYVMQKLGYLPPLGRPASSGALAVATVYRTAYGVISAYVCARLAPGRPVMHAMVLGFLGFVVSVIGLVATWQHADIYGPHWYPVLLVILALPTAWGGGKLREKQMSAPLNSLRKNSCAGQQ